MSAAQPGLNLPPKEGKEAEGKDNQVHKLATDDGWHGVIEKGGQFEPEKDRYHLYISKCC